MVKLINKKEISNVSGGMIVFFNLGFENKNNNQLNKEAVLDMLRKNEITFKEADELLKQIGG